MGGPLRGLNPTTRYTQVEKTKKRPNSSPSSGREREPAAPLESTSAAAAATATAASSAATAAAAERAEEARDDAYHVWRSRDNRKGRHAITLTPECAEKLGAPAATNSLSESLRGIGKMFLRYPVWDVSYDVATIFTWGAHLPGGGVGDVA